MSRTLLLSMILILASPGLSLALEGEDYDREGFYIGAGAFGAVYPNLTDLRLNTLDDLTPGRDPTIDTICRGVLLDGPFHRE